MNTIIINGVVIQTPDGANNISVRGGRVVVNGKDVTPDAKVISITVNGPVERLEADVCEKVSIIGAVGNVATHSGDVEITGDVSDSVKTLSGDVRCGAVAGSVKTLSGDITHR